jgi:hypothetical protein
MLSLLSQQLRLLKANNTFPAPTELQTRAEPPQIVLDINTAANRLNATANVLEERMVGILEPVVHPSPITVFFHQSRAFHQLQMPARVRLRHLQSINQFTNAQTFPNCE